MSDTAQIVGIAVIFIAVTLSGLYASKKDVSYTICYMGLALLVGMVIF